MWGLDGFTNQILTRNPRNFWPYSLNYRILATLVVQVPINLRPPFIGTHPELLNR